MVTQPRPGDQQRNGRSDAAAGESRVRGEKHFSVGAAEVGVEELEEAGLAQLSAAQRDRDKADNGRPLVGFLPVRDAKIDLHKAGEDGLRPPRERNLVFGDGGKVQADGRSDLRGDDGVVSSCVE
jgi:hypothetical protein